MSESELLSTRLSRRDLLKLGAVGTAGLLGLNPEEEASAKTPELLQGVASIKLIKPDPELAKRGYAPITDFVFNPQKELFQDVEGFKDPKNRLRNAYLKFVGQMDNLRDETYEFEDIPVDFESTAARDSTMAAQRAYSLIVPQGPDDQSIAKHLKDPDFTFPMWVYDRKETDKKKPQLKEIRPGELRIRILSKPEDAFVTLYSSGGTIAYGYTPYFVEHEGEDGQEPTNSLELGLYNVDESYKNYPALPPSKYIDGTYANSIYAAFERTILGIRPDNIEYFDQQDDFWQSIRSQTTGRALFPDMKELINGPYNPETQRFDTASVISVLSPNIPR